MINNKLKLTKQLLIIIGLIFVILTLSLGLLLPNFILPAAESSLYSYLSKPLMMNTNEQVPVEIDSEVAVIYIIDGKILTSNNINEVIKYKDKEELISYLADDYGKIEIGGGTYYYYQTISDNLTKIAITDDKYINSSYSSLVSRIMPVVLGTCLLIGLVLVLWSSYIIKKIEKLKEKIDNIDKDDYDHNIDFTIDDEIKSLLLAMEDMRLSLKTQENYRTQMYQNISHDFKTPIAVIKSYIEASEDGIEDKDKSIAVIKEQIDSLEKKVHSLLYLNKLDYLSDGKNVLNTKVDINAIILKEVEKFRFLNKNIEFIIDVPNKVDFTGNDEYWETILDNLFSNAMRYAKSVIKVTIKNNKLIVYNDGDNIEEKLLAGIFSPFRKGVNGQFGLGLSIVQKTLSLINYNITIKNEKNGVSFIISKK